MQGICTIMIVNLSVMTAFGWDLIYHFPTEAAFKTSTSLCIAWPIVSTIAWMLQTLPAFAWISVAMRLAYFMVVFMYVIVYTLMNLSVLAEIKWRQ